MQPSQKEGGAVRALPEFALKISHKDAVDLEAERARLRKEETKLQEELRSLDAQLRNEQFLSKAPAKVVDALRQRQSELIQKHAKTAETLEKLG